MPTPNPRQAIAKMGQTLGPDVSETYRTLFYNEQRGL